MMSTQGSKAVLAALMIAMGSAACAEAPVTELETSRPSDDDESAGKTKKSKSAASSDDGEDEEHGSVTQAQTKKKTTTADSTADEEEPKETAIDVSFNAKLGQKFGNVPINRTCSDIGVDFNQASVAEGTSLSLVDVYTKQTLVKVEGAEFKAIQKELVGGSGQLRIPVDAKSVPEKATEYAIVIGGDGRFGSPSKCGEDIAPKSEKDRGIKGSAGNFPTGRTIIGTRAIAGSGCGIVGYLQAYYDANTGEVYAIPSSPILIGADDEGRADFPPGASNAGCDVHASPLVLDLGGEGVQLSKKRDDLFDIDGNGTRDAVSWVSSKETPFLVRDTNGNGVVDGGTELFGNHTDASSANGFEALSKLDSTGDGVIDANDRVWDSLRLWFDRDGDGRTGPGELVTLESRGVRSIATGYVSTSERLFSGSSFEGSIRQRGAATMTDGRTVPVLDVWFERQF